MKILLVDDDNSSLIAVKKYLESPLNYEVTTFSSCDEAYSHFLENDYEIIISDIKMVGMTGIDFLKKVKQSEKGFWTDVILMTGYGELSTCIEALREGASDYLLKPISIKQLALILEIVIKRKETLRENFKLKEQISQHQIEEKDLSVNDMQLIGENSQIGIFSKKMEKIKDLCSRYHKKRTIPVLIEGETGAGKEIFARLIHEDKQKTASPFVTVNCSAITPSLLESELFGYVEGAFTGARKTGAKGKFEAAQGGTILLDEIGDMPLEMQPVLLRVIQEREIYRVGSNQPIRLDVRFIFATNKNLEEEVKNGRFRQDLYYRISTGYIKIPPLRERKTEIAPLALLFLKKFSQENACMYNAISRDVVYMLQQYYFPGNVRELKSIIERAAVVNDQDSVLRIEHLNFMKFAYEMHEKDELVLNFEKPFLYLKDIEHELARKVYKKFNGNINQGAKYLGVAWATFIKMLRLK